MFLISGDATHSNIGLSKGRLERSRGGESFFRISLKMQIIVEVVFFLSITV